MFLCFLKACASEILLNYNYSCVFNLNDAHKKLKIINLKTYIKQFFLAKQG